MRSKEYDIRNLLVYYKKFIPIIQKKSSYHLTRIMTFAITSVLASAIGIKASNHHQDIFTQTIINESLSLSTDINSNTSSPFFSSLSKVIPSIPSVTIGKEVVTDLLTSSHFPINSVESEQIIDEFLDMPKIMVDNEDVYYRYAVPYFCNEKEYETLCMIVFLEAGGVTDEEKYIDAMAVTTTILNRIDDEEWSSLGDTILEQIFYPDQFSTVKKLPNTSFSDVPEVVKNAVDACLGGIRNHNFVQFRSKNSKKPNRVQIVTNGNNYFDKMKEMAPNLMLN